MCIPIEFGKITDWRDGQPSHIPHRSAFLKNKNKKKEKRKEKKRSESLNPIYLNL